MVFTVSGVETSFWLPPLVSFVVSTFTSIGGLSGAFLLLPFQMSFLGYVHPSVSATNQFFNIVAIPTGVYRYWREGRMVWPLTWAVVVGTMPGVMVGALIRVNWLPDPRHFKLFAGLFLLYIGLRMLRDLWDGSQAGKLRESAEKRFNEMVREHRQKAEEYARTGEKLPAVQVIRFDRKRIVYDFYGERFDVSTKTIFSLSLIVGVIGGIYGIGGGAIIAPFFISFCRLPVYTIAGATLMGTFVTSIAGVVFYEVIAPFYPSMSVAPDWHLGLLFGVGGMIGMYIGARCQKFVPARLIKYLLCAVVLFTALKYVVDFVKQCLSTRDLGRNS